jgi:hypothetical protein
MKIGILCNFYGFPEYLDQVLEHWQKFSNENFIFAAASCKFDQYININYLEKDTRTIELLSTKYKKMFNYIYQEDVSNDSIVRNKPLEYLINQNVDYIWLLDGDEFYSNQDINNILNFINFNKFIPFFKINFKNYFNDQKHWVDGFCPPRIFKVKINNLRLHEFYFENDLYYLNSNNETVDYKSLSNIEIPKSLAHIKHYSWCGSKDFLKNKIKYQNLRYNGICSYKWNDSEERLELDIDNFYKRFNIEIPNIFEDN